MDEYIKIANGIEKSASLEDWMSPNLSMAKHYVFKANFNEALLCYENEINLLRESIRKNTISV